MRILVAPNAFKGSLSADAAAKAVAEGIRKSKLNCNITLFPIADGGDGTTSLLNKHWEAEIIYVPVHDPLGRRVKAPFGCIPEDRKAIIGISDASGLKLLKKEELNPLHAHTFGTGELIKALGFNYFNNSGNEINDLPLELKKLNKIDITALDKRLQSVEIIVLCDVQNKLLGDNGAAKIFGHQKGADEKKVILLEQCLKQWNNQTIQLTQINMNEIKYGGAAGGVAAGLAAYADATLISGIDFYLDQLHFDDLLRQTDLVITGEGMIDEQTLEGKGPFGIAERAMKENIPVVGMAGQIRLSSQSKLHQYFKELIAVNPQNVNLEKAITDTANNLKAAACKWISSTSFR